MLLTTFVITSCREEIISPENNGGNVNEPYTSNTRNSYTFIIDAQNLSQYVIDYPNINYFNSKVFVSVADYSAGSVEILVLNKSRDVLYRNKLNKTTVGEYAEVEGVLPAVLEFRFNNFSGKIKFQLTGVL